MNFDNEVLPLQITNQTREVIINYTKYGQKGCGEKEHDENDMDNSTSGPCGMSREAQKKPNTKAKEGSRLLYGT